ncbi:hypothetical protein BGX34_010432, partial [Mortierella sp. NVP85]
PITGLCCWEMSTRSTEPQPKCALTLQQALELGNIYLENAYKTTDDDIALLGHDAKVALSQTEDAEMKAAAHLEDVEHQGLCSGQVIVYTDLGNLPESQGCQEEEVQGIGKKADEWG